MSEPAKHCNNCRYSFRSIERDLYGKNGVRLIQHCRSAEYNSPAYTKAMLLADWGRGCCRFWQAKN